MTGRGSAVLLLAGATYAVAWAFGSMPLYPVAVGLALAALAALAWVRLAGRPVRFHRAVGRGHGVVEGEDVRVELELELDGRLPPGSAAVVERDAKLGERATVLRRRGRRLRGQYVLRRLPRGRHTLGEAWIRLEDPFAIENWQLPLAGESSFLVYPRLAELEQLFSEAGIAVGEGRRPPLRALSGFELHSVRDYEQGESLRKVHWRATAKRGRLMVKELEDAPRDEVAVVLDACAGVAAPRPAFDVQVRAAGSLLEAHARRGRHGMLIVSSARRHVQRVRSRDGDWQHALDLLASAEPSGNTPVATLLGDRGDGVAHAAELVVVTAALSPELAERLVERTLARRKASLVYVDAASFGSRRGRPERAEPALRRLQATGVPVAVLRRGDDLCAKLGRPAAVRVAGA